jgi:hypothetical protein
MERDLRRIIPQEALLLEYHLRSDKIVANHAKCMVILSLVILCRLIVFLSLSLIETYRLRAFIESKGYDFLFDLLSEVNMDVIENALSKKFIVKLLKAIS